MFFLSTYSIFGKILLSNFTPKILIVFSQATSTIILLFFLGFFPEAKRIYRLPKKDLFILIIVAILSAVIFPLLVLKGLKITSATNFIIIGRLEPVLAGVISFLWLKEKTSLHQILGVIFMMFGIFFIVTKGDFSTPNLDAGSLFIMGGATAGAFSTNIFKKYLSHILPELVVLLRNLVGAIVLFAVISFLFSTKYDTTLLFEKQVLIPLLLFAVFTMIFAQFFWYKALELIPAHTAASLALSPIFFGVILAIIILKEEIYSYHLLGGAFVIVGLIFTIFHQKEHPKHHLLEKVKHWFH